MRRMLLGIDLGTSGVKSGVFGDDGVLLGMGRSSIPEFQSPYVGWAQSDPAAWWEGVKLSLHAVSGGSGIQLPEVDAIGFSAFFPAIVPMGSDGKVLHPAILYNDQRSSPQVSRILQKVGKEAYEERIGNRLIPGTCAITSIQWLREERPDVFEESKVFGFANTYLVYMLTGEVFTDPSNAALSGLVDIRNPWEWSEQICRSLEVDRSRLPAIASSYQVVGSVSRQCASETGLRPGTPVVVGCGDAVASTFGAGALREGAVTYIGGSSDCVTMPVTKPLKDNRWLNDAYLERGTWLGIGTVTSSGAALDWFSREMLRIPREEVSRFISSLGPHADGSASKLLFLPYLQGERTPIWDPHARGVFLGLSSATTRREMATAIMTGVAFALRDVIECLEEIQGTPIRELRAVGGSTQSVLWNQIKANVLQKSIHVLNVQETGSLGAAMLAGLGRGLYRSLDEANRQAREVSCVRTFDPMYDRKSDFDEAFGLYRRLYGQTKDLMHEQVQ